MIHEHGDAALVQHEAEEEMETPGDVAGQTTPRGSGRSEVGNVIASRAAERYR